MKKTILAALLVLLLCGLCVAGCAAASSETAAAAPAAASTPGQSGDYAYIVLKDGTAEITKYTGTAEALTIPDALDGYPVTSIGDRAFARCVTDAVELRSALQSGIPAKNNNAGEPIKKSSENPSRDPSRESAKGTAKKNAGKPPNRLS